VFHPRAFPQKAPEKIDDLILDSDWINRFDDDDKDGKPITLEPAAGGKWLKLLKEAAPAMNRAAMVLVVTWSGEDRVVLHTAPLPKGALLHLK
jgi:hypothetical protein